MKYDPSIGKFEIKRSYYNHETRLQFRNPQMSYLAIFVFDIFDNHYDSVKKYLSKEGSRSEEFLVRRVSVVHKSDESE